MEHSSRIKNVLDSLFVGGGRTKQIEYLCEIQDLGGPHREGDLCENHSSGAQLFDNFSLASKKPGASFARGQ